MNVNHKYKLLIFLDHDIIIRHFLETGVLRDLEKYHEVIYVVPKNHKRVKKEIYLSGPTKVFKIEINEKRSYRWRRLYHAKTIRSTWRNSDGENLRVFWKRNLGRAYYRSLLASLPGIYFFYKSWAMFKIGKNNYLKKLIGEEKPDILIHPTVLEGLFVSDLIKMGRQNKIPTLYIMNSWDNPSTKTTTVGYPDRLVVWGEQTKEHAMRYMGISEKRISILGAAQFLIYQNLPEMDRNEFRKKEGIAYDIKVLLYAGSSKGLNEIQHLKNIDEAIESGRIQKCKILYRPHPWKNPHPKEEYFYDIDWNNVQMATSMDKYYRSIYDRKGLTTPRYMDTYNTLNAVDCVVSPLSTILLESAMLGKPIIVYTPNDDLMDNHFLYTVTNLHQFTEFFERVDCIRTSNEEDFIHDIQTLIEKTNDKKYCENLKKMTEYFVANTDYIEELNKLIKNMIQNKNGK